MSTFYGPFQFPFLTPQTHTGRPTAGEIGTAKRSVVSYHNFKGVRLCTLIDKPDHSNLIFEIGVDHIADDIALAAEYDATLEDPEILRCTGNAAALNLTECQEWRHFVIFNASGGLLTVNRKPTGGSSVPWITVPAGGSALVQRYPGSSSSAPNWQVIASGTTDGILDVRRGGTGANLAGTGGSGQVVKQLTTGGPLIPLALVASDIPNLDATKITTGALALARGGTGADLSATGGAGQVVKQASAGGAFTVAALTPAELGQQAAIAGDVVAWDGSAYGPRKVSDQWKRRFEFFTDFCGTPAEWVTATSGGSFSTTALGPTTGRVGIARSTTGTGTTGRVGSGFGNLSSMTCSGGAMGWEWCLVPTTMSGGADSCTCRFGFVDSVSGAPTDGVFFQFDLTLGTLSNWKIGTRNNSSETLTTTGTAVTVGTFVTLRVEVNAAGTSAEFFVDGVSVGTIATNIPASAGREFGFGFSQIKSAGTTNEILDHDFARCWKDFDVARAA